MTFTSNSGPANVLFSFSGRPWWANAAPGGHLMDAPKGLAAAGSALWKSIAGTYELRPDESRVLVEACREADLIESMNEALAELPLMTTGSMGQPVVHPFVSEVRQHRTVLAALLRSLKLPDDSAGAGAVNQQRQAGNASWARRGA